MQACKAVLLLLLEEGYLLGLWAGPRVYIHEVLSR